MIILRQEKFGGIAFNSDNAYELWLDKELFESNKKSLSENVKKKLAVEKSVFKLLDSLPEIKHDFPFTILNSPVLADINITSKCNSSCPHCYMNSSKNGEHMSLKDFQFVLDQCQKLGIFQIALGGGEPTIHPLLGQFLKETRKRNIVPNLTTNGRKLSWKTAYYLARYTGAVALSIEELGERFEQRRGFPFKDFLLSVKKLKKAGINLVFQITVSKGNLKRVNQLVQEMVKFKPYGILFLAYKPQGRGIDYDYPLSSADNSEVKKVFNNIFKDLKGKTRIGFDCCLTPILVNIKKSPSFTGCSASRKSLAIMPDLRVMPCSFLNNNEKYENLKDKSLLDIWKGNVFNDFRSQIANKMQEPNCRDCSKKEQCLGGCPIFKLV